MLPPVLEERAIVRRDFAILPHVGLCESPLPTYRRAVVKILAAPVMGADFAEYLVDLMPDGRSAKPIEESLEYFVFGLKGGVRLEMSSEHYSLGVGGFAYIPPETPFSLVNEAPAGSSLLILKRRYLPFEADRPPFLFGDEAEIAGSVYMGLEGVILRKLLPEDASFDMAINIFSFEPGTSLPVIETHIMQHGLYLLEGQGMYYLGRNWYQVKEGDFIWIGHFTPQSFYCTGRVPARYIYYKDINRDVVF